ncbi:unnamed protein product [Sphenostylis stenocarpa]|uniref:Hydroxyproline-rich glycoprotein family protein n=1 Tax=Sphenostylis stenocarpa TaxID=92480 RepID=A0AA86VX37_9FABA|nr:unnamed protein product [Sphenostylis stenocarpa]
MKCIPKRTSKAQSKAKGESLELSFVGADQLILMVEIHKKILAFRDIMDLAPCNSSASLREMVMKTLQDLQVLYPGIIPKNEVLKIKGKPMDKAMAYFCKALKSIGELWIVNNNWMKKLNVVLPICKDNSNMRQLGETMLATLDALMKLASDQFDVEEDEHKKELSPRCSSYGKYIMRSTSFSDSSYSYCSSPPTPRSVLPELTKHPTKSGDSPRSSCASPLLLSLRVQAVGKLNPIDVKRLSFQMSPAQVHKIEEESSTRETEEDDKATNHGKDSPEELVFHLDTTEELDSPTNDHKKATKPFAIKEVRLSISSSHTEPQPKSPKLEKAPLVQQESLPVSSPSITPPPSIPQPPPPPSPQSMIKMQIIPTPPPPPPSPSPSKMMSSVSLPPQVPAPPLLQPNVAVSPTPPPPPPSAPKLEQTEVEIRMPTTPSPPRPPSSGSVTNAAPPPPPPPPPSLPPSSGSTTSAAPLPPPSPNPLKGESVPAPPPPNHLTGGSVPAPPPPNPLTGGSVPAPPPPNPSTGGSVPAPPPPNHLTGGSVPAPPPPNPSTGGSVPAPPPPNPSTGGSVPAPPPPNPLTGGPVPAPPPPNPLKGGSVPAPPPAAPGGSKAGAPPPPPIGGGRSLSAKATSKLKRSTHLGNLYRSLKGKFEGSTVNVKSSSGKKGGVGGASTGGKQGMADALAEMTKRSSYFQQIEEDVQKYTKQILELRSTITNFKTKDMTELAKFHRDVESVLEKLTDESQVLSRFEGFPTKKLEALRMAAALYNKLYSILTELQNWKVEPPMTQQLDKVERYFSKIKTELDALERTKDEEAKKFKGHNIIFDFHILVKIKEALVDVSSNCMELSLKEKGNAGAKKDGAKKEGVSLLWKAFQFAFRVYTFAGGLDDRADNLTRQLAKEIESEPNQA